MKVKVEYTGDIVVDRTPVIVLTDQDIFPKDMIFQSRMIKYEWKPYDDLKQVTKKIHPMGFHKLLISHAIINDKCMNIYDSNLFADDFVSSDYNYTDSE